MHWLETEDLQISEVVVTGTLGWYDYSRRGVHSAFLACRVGRRRPRFSEPSWSSALRLSLLAPKKPDRESAKTRLIAYEGLA
jgi:hypothetical protein